MLQVRGRSREPETALSGPAMGGGDISRRQVRAHGAKAENGCFSGLEEAQEDKVASTRVDGYDDEHVRSRFLEVAERQEERYVSKCQRSEGLKQWADVSTRR